MWKILDKLSYLGLFCHFIKDKMGQNFHKIEAVRLVGGDPPKRSAWPLFTSFFFWWLPSWKNKNFSDTLPLRAWQFYEPEGNHSVICHTSNAKIDLVLIKCWCYQHLNMSNNFQFLISAVMDFFTSLWCCEINRQLIGGLPAINRNRSKVVFDHCYPPSTNVGQTDPGLTSLQVSTL